MRVYGRLRSIAFAGLLSFAAQPPAGAGSLFLWDQSDFALDDSFPISFAVQAADFTVGATARLDAADVWLADLTVNDDGQLNSFSGVLSWAIYSDAGANPATILRSGTDFTVGLADTGLQDVYGDDVVRVRIEFDGRVVLAPGTYWLVLHEGPWGSASDGSEISWALSSSVVGSTLRGSSNPVTPGSWTPGTRDLAFALYGGPLLWEQSSLAAGGDGTGISTIVTANDFTAAAPGRAGSLDAWLLDSEALENDYADRFSGALGWAVYASSAGAPGALIASGTDATPQVEDAGINGGGGDLVRVRIELTPPLQLEAGTTYWLALHEGAWLSPSDGSQVLWYDSTAMLGAGQKVDTDPTSPGTWSVSYAYNSAFVLFDEPIFASGFERGSTLAWLSISDISCRQGSDTDGDRLDDCFESNTGRFFDSSNTGTDPENPDTDGDGLGDGDETLGTPDDLDLPGMGTNPLRQDLLLEYDWFDDAVGCAAHSHRPTPGQLALVTSAFAAAPRENPDGTTGIHFIHDYGQGGLFIGGNLVADADGLIPGTVDDAAFQGLKAANFAASREGYFHYAVLPHQYGNAGNFSSGFAELPGDDLIVSMACFGNDLATTNTIVHELGHNLNLRHGGDSNCNYKPNYNSVMNYKYQFPGVDSDCNSTSNGVVDYSHGDRIALDENDLDEAEGVCGAPSIDWNGSGTITAGVVFDVNSAFGTSNQNTYCGGRFTLLTDHDDWTNVQLGGLADADGALLLKESIACQDLIAADNR